MLVLAYPWMLCFDMLCYAMLCYAMLCYAMLCYAMPCHAMLCYAMLCYAMQGRLLVNMIEHRKRNEMLLKCNGKQADVSRNKPNCRGTTEIDDERRKLTMNDANRRWTTQIDEEQRKSTVKDANRQRTTQIDDELRTEPVNQTFLSDTFALLCFCGKLAGTNTFIFWKFML